MDTAAAGPRMGAMPFPLQTICWVCLKPVPPETMPDEFGFFVHEACLATVNQKDRPKTG